ncbi:MAG: UvrB/UvrC motif-containing protein [Verrucomicrobiota bacterium]
MAKAKKCIHCEKTATIHLTQIVGGEIKKVDLCEDCQFKDSMAADFDLEPFAKLAEEVSAATPVELGGEHVCPQCGCDDEQFHKAGRFGCPECYDAFEEVVPDILRKIQAGLVHSGKAPANGEKDLVSGRLKTEARKELESAVREERFEDAAVHRDRLRRLERGELDEAED